MNYIFCCPKSVSLKLPDKTEILQHWEGVAPPPPPPPHTHTHHPSHTPRSHAPDPQTLRFFLREVKNIKHDRYFPQGFERLILTKTIRTREKLAELTATRGGYLSNLLLCAAGLKYRSIELRPISDVELFMCRMY
jgi:hypothetical protein